MFETQLAEQIKAQQREDDDPQRQIYFPVENSPMVGLVGDAEELQSERELQKSQYDLDRIEPASAFGQAVQQRGEQGEQREGQREHDREGQHRENGSPYLARSRLDQYGTHDRARARERDQHERQRHEKDTSQAAPVRPFVASVHQTARHRDLERSEKGGGENHEDEEEDHVRNPVRGQPVENVGRDGSLSEEVGDDDDDRDRQRVESDDAKSVGQRSESAPRPVLAAFHEKRHGHRNHRKDAGCQQGCQSPQHGLDDGGPQ